MYISKRDAQLAVKFLAPMALPMTVKYYTGAENFGLYAKVGSGSPAVQHRFLSVIKTEPLLNGLINAVDLLPPLESSGKNCASHAAISAEFVVYDAEATGDFATFRLPVSQAGTYRLGSYFMKSPSYGKIQVKLDGLPIGNVIDLYNNVFQLSSMVDFGNVYLSQGDHQLTLEVVGKNASSSNYYASFDSITLEPVGGSETPKTTIDASLIQNNYAIGAQVNRGGGSTITDLVLFKTGADSYILNGVESGADQVLVSHDSSNAVMGYAMTRGVTLKYNTQTLLEGSASFSGSFSYDASTMKDSGVIEVSQAMSVNIYCRSNPVTTVDGQTLQSGQYTFNDLTHILTISLSAGRHNIVID